MSLRGFFGNSSSSTSSRNATSKNNSQHSGSDPQSPTRRSFAFMKYSPGRRSNSSMRRIREHTGQIAQQISTPDPHESLSSGFNPYGLSPAEKYQHARMPQDRDAAPLYDNVIDVNRRPLKPPAQNRKKVALNMFMEQQGGRGSSGPGSVGSDASSRASSVTGAAARRLARAKQHQPGNNMSTFPSNSSMQRNFVQNKSSNQSVSSSSTAARRRMRSQLKVNTKKESVSTVETFYSEMDDDSLPNATPRQQQRLTSGGSTGGSSRSGRQNYSRHRVPSTDEFSAASPDLTSMEASHGFTFDAFGLDAEEVDSEVNAALQDLAGSHPHLSRMFGGEGGFPLDSPAGSYSASTPTMDVEGESSDVDGFKIMSSLPMNISRPSPASSERSTLTGSSPTDGNEQDGRINMFKQQAGFQRSKKSKSVFNDSDDGWESFEPSPNTPRYAVSEPGGVFFGNSWSSNSMKKAPAMPKLFDDADSSKEKEQSDKGSDADFDQSSWQGDSDGELSPENVKQLQANAGSKPKGESFTFDDNFGDANIEPDTAAQSSAGDFGFGSGFGTPALHFRSDAGPPSSAGGARLESDAGASSNMGVPSDVGVMHFDSDVGVASDAAFSNDFMAAPIPEQILGKKAKTKQSQESVVDSQAEGEFDSDGFGVPVKKVSSLAAKWERQESENSAKSPARVPVRQVSRSPVSSDGGQIDEELLFPEVIRHVESPRKSPGRKEHSKVESPHKSPGRKQHDRFESPRKSPGRKQQPPSDGEIKRIRLKDLPNDGPIGPNILSDKKTESHAEQHRPAGPEILSKTKVKKPLEQQKRATECAAQRTSFGSYKERLRSAHLRNGAKPTSSKSEAGGYSFSAQSQVNSMFNKMQSSQSRETKSESGASSDFLSGVKLRKTGGISRLLSNESSEDDTEKFQSQESDYHIQQPQHEQLAYEEHREPETTEVQRPKLTYRERRELELKQQAEQARKEAEQKEKEQKERDVAALIRKRIAANKNKTVEAKTTRSNPEEDITAIRNRLKKVTVDSDCHSQGKPSPIALEEETLTTENSYFSNSLEKVSAENAAHHQVDFHPASSSTGRLREKEKNTSVEPSYYQVPTHVHTLRSNEDEVMEAFATFPDSMDVQGVHAIDSDETLPQSSPSPARKVSAPPEIKVSTTHSSPSPARKIALEVETEFSEILPQRFPSPGRKIAAQGEPQVSKTTQRRSPSPARKNIAEDEIELSRTPPISSPPRMRKSTPPGETNNVEPASPGFSKKEKESKKAMLSAFFGKKLGLPQPPPERDTVEEPEKPQSPAMQSDPPSAQEDFFHNAEAAVLGGEHNREEATELPTPADKPKGVSSQLDMDVHAATAVLMRKNKQSQAPKADSENVVQTQETSEEEQSSAVQTESTPSLTNRGAVALKDDPQYEKYFRMLKVGMPMEVVKHAMTRDGIDASVMDGDHNKPAGGVPLKEDPKYEKYFKMLKMGLPMGAVQNAMMRDGLDPSVMDGDHNAPAGGGSCAPAGKVEKKPKDTHRRTRLHWETLRKVRANSLWAKINEDPELQELNIDEEEFAALFQAELTPSRFQAKKSPAPTSPTKKRGPSVRVIDAKRANNGGIALARLHISQDDLADVVDKIDDSGITAEQMQHIVQYLPTAEERKNLEKYMLEGGQDAAEKFDMLCECEKFMVAMMTVKHAKRKVRALLFKLQFETCLGSLEEDATTVETACDELSNSVRLRKLLGIVLNIGNRLNTAGNGSKRKAGAFTLESLLKLSHAKAFDRKTTFLHYVVLIVQRNNELLLRFKDDLPTVMKANKVYWDQCLTDLEEVENQLENVRRMALHQARLANIYRLKKKKKPPSDNADEDSLSEVEMSLEEEVESLRGTPLGQFTLHAIKKVSSLREQVEVTNQKFGKLLEYFGEEDKRSEMQPHELFTIIYDFCKDFDKAKEHVVANEKKKLREERKRQASVKKLAARPKVSARQTSLRASNMQPNMSNILKEMTPKSPSARSDPGLRPAYSNNVHDTPLQGLPEQSSSAQNAPVQRLPEQRNDTAPKPRPPSQSESPNRYTSLENPTRSSPPKKPAPSIPMDPYNTSPAPVTAHNNSLRQKARLRRQKQVADARSQMAPSTTSMTEQSARSNSPRSHHQGRPPLDQTLSPRSSIRYKRRMQQRNGLVGSQGR